MTLTKQLTYRLDFFIGRSRNLVILLLFYSVWQAVTAGSGMFAGFTTLELTKYVLLVHILRSFMFGSQSTAGAEEIALGQFSFYLVRPVRYFWVYYAREAADHTVATVSAILEATIVCALTRTPLLLGLTPLRLGEFFILSVGGHWLYMILNYCINLLAFWSHEYNGPRFLFDWFVELSSGAFFPLTVASGVLITFFNRLPSTLFIFRPTLFYLNHGASISIFHTLLELLAWILIFYALALFMWKRGLKKYTSPGI